MNAVHLIREELYGRIVTACGKHGWRCRNSVNEFDTANNDRFEAVTAKRMVTCKTCRKTQAFDPEALS